MRQCSRCSLLALFSALVCLLCGARFQLTAQSHKSAQAAKPGVGQRELSLPVDDEVKVRSIKPPVHYDDQGKRKTLSADELKALKGNDSKTPGYARDFADLESGQVVRVYVSRQRKPGPADKEKAADTKKEDNKADKSPWIPLGEITGVLTKVNNHPRGKNASGKTKKSSTSAAKKLTLHLEYAKMSGSGGGTSSSKITLLDRDYVTMIVIIREEQDPPAKSTKP